MADDSKEVILTIKLRVFDEDKLRDIASDRMANSGFEADPKLHRDNPLHELLFEALIGSNPDTVSPDEMGIEIVDWTGGE